MYVSKAKNAAVREFMDPDLNKTEIILGLCNVFRRFDPSFLKVVIPLNKN